jgi:hypothetical protein
MRPTALVALAASAVIALAGCSGSSASPEPSTSNSVTPAPTYTAPPSPLPTIPVSLTTAQPPWAPPIVTNPEQSADYVTAAGFQYAAEMLTVHYHAHLDINVNGSAVAVPQGVGFVAKGNEVVGLAPLHTHDSTGIIHIENSVPAVFTLGQFFIEWGVKFTPTCLGPFCAGNGKQLAAFVDGNRYTADPTQIVLKKHEEIAIEYGDIGKLPTPPSSYAFPAGL